MNIMRRALIALTAAVTVASAGAVTSGAAHADGPVITAPTGIAVETPTGEVIGCTLAAIGKDKNNPTSPRGITAGHCAGLNSSETGQKVYLRNGKDIDFSRQIGVVEEVTGLADDASDAALISFMRGVRVNTGISLDGESQRGVAGVLPFEEVDRARPMLCSHGMTSGYKCGQIDLVGSNDFIVDYPSEQGDSGAGVFARDKDGTPYLVGVISQAKDDGRAVMSKADAIAEHFNIVWGKTGNAS